MHKLIEYVCDELEELEKKADKGGLSSAEIEYADKLAHLKKNLLKGEELYDEMDYSGDMYGNPRSNMARGMSYAQRRDRMGRYSSGRGYSRDGHEMAERLRDLMHDATDEGVRRDIERLMHKVEQM